MISKAASSFWKNYDALPTHIQQLAVKNFEMWLANPDYPSIRFKAFKKNFWSARVDEHYRAVGYYRDSETFVWTWIGTHEAYNKF